MLYFILCFGHLVSFIEEEKKFVLLFLLFEVKRLGLFSFFRFGKCVHFLNRLAYRHGLVKLVNVFSQYYPIRDVSIYM